MKRTNVYLPEKQVERLQKQAEQEGVTQAEIMRRALEVYFAWNDPMYASNLSRPERNTLVSPA